MVSESVNQRNYNLSFVLVQVAHKISKISIYPFLNRATFGQQSIGKYLKNICSFHKAEYVLQNSLRGIMIDDIGMDDFRDECGEGTFPLLTKVNDVLANVKISTITTTPAPIITGRPQTTKSRRTTTMRTTTKRTTTARPITARPTTAQPTVICGIDGKNLFIVVHIMYC